MGFLAAYAIVFFGTVLAVIVIETIAYRVLQRKELKKFQARALKKPVGPPIPKNAKIISAIFRQLR